MLLDGSPLLVSLPGAEVGRIDWPGSVAGPDVVLAAPISPQLRAAFGLLHEEALARGVNLHCLARPELFTHGESRAWLRDQVNDAACHVCLTDGSTFKPIDGVANHLFFYGSPFAECVAALDRLGRRAPELWGEIRGQVNSCFALGRGAHRARPEPIFLHRAAPRAPPPSRLMKFFLNRDSAEDSANRIEHAGPVDPAALTNFACLRYLPLTGTALADRAFGRFLGHTILGACFDPDALLILRLPAPTGGAGDLMAGIAAIIPALREAGMIIPRALRDHILVTVDDLDEDHILFNRWAPHLMVHESFDFWRHTAGFYARARRVTVLAGAETTPMTGFIPHDVQAIYGAGARRLWLADPAAD